MTAEQLKAKFKLQAFDHFDDDDAAEKVKNFEACIDSLYLEPTDTLQTDDLIFIMTGLTAGLQ